MANSCIIKIHLILLICNAAESIIHGEIAQPGQFKYQALLVFYTTAGFHICGGVIIDNRHVLTAWHCVEDIRLQDIKVIVGAVKYHRDPNARAYDALDVKLHKGRRRYDWDTRYYDIAVITTSAPIEYTSYIEEILLPHSDINPGDECVFAGWGATEYGSKQPSLELRYGYGQIYHRMFCQGWLEEILKDYEFCILPVRGTTMSTINAGDSGIGVVCDGVLAGIAVRGHGDPKRPVTVINVYQLRDFILGTEDADVCYSGNDI